MIESYTDKRQVAILKVLGANFKVSVKVITLNGREVRKVFFDVDINRNAFELALDEVSDEINKQLR